MVGQTWFDGMIVENTDGNYSARVLHHLALLLPKASWKWGELIPDQSETKVDSWGQKASCVYVCEREMMSWHLPAFLLLTTGGRLSQPNKQTDQLKTCQTKGIKMRYWGFVNKIYLQWICTYYLLLAQKGNCNWRGGTVFICFITNGLTIQDRPFRSSSGAVPVHGYCSQTALGRTNHSGKRSGQQVPKVHWK